MDSSFRVNEGDSSKLNKNIPSFTQGPSIEWEGSEHIATQMRKDKRKNNHLISKEGEGSDNHLVGVHKASDRLNKSKDKKGNRYSRAENSGSRLGGSVV